VSSQNATQPSFVKLVGGFFLVMGAKSNPRCSISSSVIAAVIVIVARVLVCMFIACGHKWDLMFAIASRSFPIAIRSLAIAIRSLAIAIRSLGIAIANFSERYSKFDATTTI
jgi:Kef-type K+ transport system membrane component KefB